MTPGCGAVALASTPGSACARNGSARGWTWGRSPRGLTADGGTDPHTEATAPRPTALPALARERGQRVVAGRGRATARGRCPVSAAGAGRALGPAGPPPAPEQTSGPPGSRPCPGTAPGKLGAPPRRRRLQGCPAPPLGADSEDAIALHPSEALRQKRKKKKGRKSRESLLYVKPPQALSRRGVRRRYSAGTWQRAPDGPGAAQPVPPPPATDDRHPQGCARAGRGAVPRAGLAATARGSRRLEQRHLPRAEGAWRGGRGRRTGAWPARLGHGP